MKSIKKKRSMASHRKLHFQKVLSSMIVALALLFAGSAGAQETKTIKGMVRDVTGEPLIGASVIEKGTNNGVITDVDGNFTLTVPADATLSIAYMGYATREIHLAKRKKQGDLRVTLREDSQQLKEVVVTAMGIKKDTKRLGYAVSTIESDEIVKAGATNFASAMYGKAPGIRITQTQGGSAGAVSINVRGLTSITGNNQPLIILDGVPIRNGGTGKSTDFAEFGNDGQIRSNGLVDINPEDIESVSVLKGASATALYGSEAANGAVVITSKRAKSGKLTVDFTAQVTANLPAYLPKVQTVYGPGRYNTEYSDYEKQTGGFYQRTMNGESYRSLYNTTMSFGPKYDGSDVLYWDGKMRPYLPATDNPWKELFRTGWNQTYNLAISQGTETSSNRFSYTFMGETPNSLTGSFTKHNFKLTGSYKPARTLNIEYSLNYIVQDVKDRPQTSLNLYGSFSNMFSSFMDIPYLKQSYVTSLGYRNTYAGGDVMLNFNYNIRRFDIAATLGWTGRYENMNNMRVSTNGGLVTENWFDLNASRYTASSTLQRMELLKTGYMGTLSLGWDNYLFLELTGRQERSSTLKDQSFFYPSANLSFLFSNAFRMPAWWNHGKLRLSYGVVGNAPETYAANIIYEQGSDNGFTWNYVPSSWGNANIRPEKKYEYEIGFESKFLNNRLGFDVSYYNNRVKDQILSTPQPSTSGVKYVLMNVGEVANEGWDISVSATPVLTKNFRWDLTANYGIYRNKVVKLADGVPYLEISNIGGGGAKIQAVEGRPMGDIYVQVPQMNENGEYLVSDKGLYMNQTELQRVGNINPDGVGGLFSSFSYKNIFLDFSIDFRIGGDVINEMYQYSTASGLTPESLQFRDTEHGGLSYYYPGNNNASGVPVQVDPSLGAGPNGETVYHDGVILPGVVASTGEKNTRIIPAGYYYNQTYNWGTQPEQLTYRHSVFDNSYVKLRELTIGYQFPEKLISKLGMTRLSVSVFGRNLFYFYKALKNYDAESSVGTSWASQAVVGGSTTATRNFGVSLRASF